MGENENDGDSINFVPDSNVNSTLGAADSSNSTDESPIVFPGKPFSYNFLFARLHGVHVTPS